MSRSKYLELVRLMNQSKEGKTDLSLDDIRELAYLDYHYGILSVTQYSNVVKESYRIAVGIYK